LTQAINLPELLEVKNKLAHLLEFFIDVSGTPPAKTCFALVSFNPYTKDEIIEEFFDKYPQYINKKGRELNPQDYINTIKFFDEKKVKMIVFPRSKNDWSYYKQMYGTNPEYLQRISGIMYMHLLHSFAWENTRYNVVSCVESQLGDIHRVFHHCKRIISCSHSQLKFSFNHSHDYDNPGLKIADFIAYTARYITPVHLSDLKIKNYHILRDRPPKWYFRVIFT
jgi:hypothetical protein